jgi:hypothetical protein
MPLSTETSTSAGPSRLATHRRVPVCGCGQDLDAVRGRHCPRYGIALLAQLLAAAA